MPKPATPTEPMPANSPRYQPTLYEKIGGRDAIERLVYKFYAKVLADDELAPYFAHVPMDKLRRMQLEFFSAALGGPVRYAGRSIAHAHHGLHVSLPHFQRFVACLFDTLREFPLSENERVHIIERINLYADEVTGQPGGF